jgi:UDP:flavonoid glycosyltransferase YjiC (YdhE family)
VRLIFASLASHGHLYPLLPLAVAAQRAGHDVVFATDESFHPSVRRAGLEPVAAGLPFGAMFAREAAKPRNEMTADELMAGAMKVFGDIIPRQTVLDLGPIIEAAKPDLLVYEVANFGAAYAAKLAGVPAIAHGFGLYSPRPPLLAEYLPALARELGVDLPDDGYSFGNSYLDIAPPSLQPAAFKAGTPRIELRPVPWAEPGELPAGVLGRDTGRPLVYLTLGTAFGDVGVLRQAIEGLAKLPADVVVAAGPTVTVADLGGVPDNVRLEAWVAQADLLPHVDLVVHHGGSGTTLGALSAGKPQLLLPQGADQFANAEIVTAAGVARRALPPEQTADVVFEHARSLLADTGARDGARSFSEEIAAMPSPDEVARRLPEFATPG